MNEALAITLAHWHYYENFKAEFDAEEILVEVMTNGTDPEDLEDECSAGERDAIIFALS